MEARFLLARLNFEQAATYERDSSDFKQTLDAAALTAVGQWSYTPTLLNGVPVPVIMTVTVTFKLR